MTPVSWTLYVEGKKLLRHRLVWGMFAFLLVLIALFSWRNVVSVTEIRQSRVFLQSVDPKYFVPEGDISPPPPQEIARMRQEALAKFDASAKRDLAFFERTRGLGLAFGLTATPGVYLVILFAATSLGSEYAVGGDVMLHLTNPRRWPWVLGAWTVAVLSSLVGAVLAGLGALVFSDVFAAIRGVGTTVRFGLGSAATTAQGLGALLLIVAFGAALGLFAAVVFRNTLVAFVVALLYLALDGMLFTYVASYAAFSVAGAVGRLATNALQAPRPTTFVASLWFESQGRAPSPTVSAFVVGAGALLLLYAGCLVISRRDTSVRPV